MAGPDFFNAKISIAGQLWAGNVEIHVKSSDWHAHGHEKDPAYENVILHVVWEKDVPVYRKGQNEIPTLELKGYVAESLLEEYRNLLDKEGKRFINCERDLAHMDGFIVGNWLERLYFERLERKSKQVEERLNRTKNDWEQVLFSLLLQNFGSTINKDSFASLAQVLDYTIIRKIQNDPFKTESVFFGLMGLLEDDFTDQYYIKLKKEYDYLAAKFDFDRTAVLKPDFFKLRPANFPTLRLSQLAHIYAQHPNLFSKVVQTWDLEDFYAIFRVSASSYWDTRYTFGKSSKKVFKKRPSKSFVHLLLINTILPLKLCYGQRKGIDVNDKIISLISQLKKEENHIIKGFSNVGVKAKNAMESQAIIQLYSEYCTKNRCLQCAIGGTLLRAER